jgi:hypothetical protein
VHPEKEVQPTLGWFPRAGPDFGGGCDLFGGGCDLFSSTAVRRSRDLNVYTERNIFWGVKLLSFYSFKDSICLYSLGFCLIDFVLFLRGLKMPQKKVQNFQ